MNQLTFDSIYGILNGITVNGEESLSLLGQPVYTTHCMSPIEIPWKQFGVSVVFECSGRFTTLTQCEGHRAAGCERVIVATPSKDIPMVCKHVSKSTSPILSVASPSTCCLAPLLHPHERGIEAEDDDSREGDENQEPDKECRRRSLGRLFVAERFFRAVVVAHFYPVVIDVDCS